VSERGAGACMLNVWAPPRRQDAKRSHAPKFEPVGPLFAKHPILPSAYRVVLEELFPYFAKN